MRLAASLLILVLLAGCADPASRQATEGDAPDIVTPRPIVIQPQVVFRDEAGAETRSFMRDTNMTIDPTGTTVNGLARLEAHWTAERDMAMGADLFNGTTHPEDVWLRFEGTLDIRITATSTTGDEATGWYTIDIDRLEDHTFDLERASPFWEPAPCEPPSRPAGVGGSYEIQRIDPMWVGDGHAGPTVWATPSEGVYVSWCLDGEPLETIEQDGRVGTQIPTGDAGFDPDLWVVNLDSDAPSADVLIDYSSAATH